MTYLTVKALVGLTLFDLLAVESKFRRVHSLVREWKISKRGQQDRAVERVSEAINRACCWYPKRVLCLQRSVVTICMLRDIGVPAEMVLGANRLPFKAHAWVEVAGQPINERENVRQSYLVWDRW